ncbi:ABC transporter substrate-binding protein [Longirhabdus pacifica]|uniref:ABC transporter substrate-binding protein n=1 Tax=Longirhabdus pacifica TaxID=2305227 RepID=UPI001008B489|nr:extracellular solute-binding protein [Longirhabdus pacifica]
MNSLSRWILFVILIFCLFFIVYQDEQGQSIPVGTFEVDLDDAMNVSTMDEVKQLSVTLSLSVEEFAALQSITDNFMLANNDIRVELINLEQVDVYEKIKQSLLIQDTSDIVLLENDWIREFASLGVLADANAFGSLSDLIYSPLYPSIQWNGYTWAVPKNMDPYVLVLNESKSLEYDIPLPIKNADDFVKVYTTLREEEVYKSGLYVNIQSPYELITFLSLMDSTEGNFNPFIELIGEQQENIINMEYMAVNDVFSSSEDDEVPLQKIKDGTYMMQFVPLSDYIRYGQGDENVVMQPVPVFTLLENEIAGFMHGTSYSISSSSSNKDEAMEWISYVTSSTSNGDLSNVDFTLPPTSYTPYVMKWLPDEANVLIESIEEMVMLQSDPYLESQKYQLQMQLQTAYRNNDESEEVWNEVFRLLREVHSTSF